LLSLYEQLCGKNIIIYTYFSICLSYNKNSILFAQKNIYNFFVLLKIKYLVIYKIIKIYFQYKSCFVITVSINNTRILYIYVCIETITTMIIGF